MSGPEQLGPEDREYLEDIEFEIIAHKRRDALAFAIVTQLFMLPNERGYNQHRVNVIRDELRFLQKVIDSGIEKLDRQFPEKSDE